MTKDSVVVNTKTLVLATMMFFGSALGGGGISFYTSPKQELAALQREVADFKGDLKQMNILAQSIVQITTKAEGDRKEIDEIKNKIEKLEERTLRLERGR